jgi:translocation and assembly module TamB
MSDLITIVRKWGVKLLRIAGLAIAGAFILSLTLSLLIQIPAIQQRLVQRAVSLLEEKINTPVSLDQISIRIPKTIVLSGLYVEDQKRDTLLYVGKLSVNTNLLALLRNKIELKEIGLEKLTGTVTRSPEGVFNFDYIINAFAGDSSQEKAAETASYDFSIRAIELKQLHLAYRDAMNEDEAEASVDHFKINAREFNLNKSVIKIGDVAVSGVTATVVQGKMPQPTLPDEEENSAFPIDLGIQSVELADIDIHYRQVATGLVVALALGNSRIEADALDLQDNKIVLDEFSLTNTTLAYQQQKIHPAGPEPVDTMKATANETTGPAWYVVLKKLTLANNNIQYNDFNYPQAQGLDPNHLSLKNITLEAKEIELREHAYTVQLDQLSFLDKAGFEVRALQADLQVTSQQASVKNFFLETSNSKIQLEVHSEFASLTTLATDYPSATINLTITDSKVALPDIVFFQPGLLHDIPLNLPTEAVVQVNATLSGTIADLLVQSLSIKTLEETLLQAQGTIKGLPEVDQTQLNIVLKKFYTTQKDIKAIVPDTLLPASLTLPQWAQLSGDFSGTVSAPRMNMLLDSDLGKITMQTAVTSAPQPGYTTSIHLHHFNAGKFLQQADWGTVDLTASLKGTGLSTEEVDATFKVVLNELTMNGYTYKDFQLEGGIAKNIASVKGGMTDPNLLFQLNGNIDLGDEETPGMYGVDLKIKNADLRALNITGEPFSVHGDFLVDLKDLENLNGMLAIRNAAIFKNGQLYKVDSLVLTSVNHDEGTSIKLDSDIIQGEFSGSFNLAHLPEVMTQYFHTYYALQDTVRAHEMDPQYFEFALSIKNTALLTHVLFPDLKRFVPGEIRGVFNSEEKNLDINIHIKEIEYASVTAKDLLFNVSSDHRKLEYKLTSSTIEAGDIHIPLLDFSGRVGSDSVTSRLIIYDSLQQERYVLAGIFYSMEDLYKFHFLPDQVMLNYDRWSVPPDNYLAFGNSGFQAHQMVLTNNRQEIKLKAHAHRDSALSVSLRQLEIQTLANMALSKDTLIRGQLSGDIRIQATPGKEVSANLKIDGLALSEFALGDIHMAVEQNSAERYDMELTLKGPSSDARVKGYYQASETSPQLDVAAEILALDLRAIEPLLFGHVQEMRGNLKGSLTLAGAVNDPEVNGDLTFAQVSFIPSYTKSKLKLENETIFFSRKGIALRNFEIQDNQNNALRVSGTLEAESNQPFKFNLVATARNFLVLNTRERDNELFYGVVRMNTTTRINGTSDHPEIDMEVSLVDGSELTYIVPQEELSVMEQEGTVKFVVNNPDENPFLKSLGDEIKNSTEVPVITGITLTAKIALSGKETFNIVIDPVTGDKLVVKGNTTLTFDMDPKGNMNLAGRYEITSGSYGLTFYKLVKRDFQIQKGSSITWAGDPLNATLDITALYQVETSPADLLINQVDASQDMSQYSQRLPFMVHLNVKGYLLKPDISFALDMPEQKRNALGGSVYAVLQDINTRETDLNKQVFALLILQQFVADNPFQTQGGSGLENAARTSVSKLLTDQLNRMSGNIKGVQLSFDLKSYEQFTDGKTEDKTKLQLGLSKTLFKDRLVVKLSGNVNPDGTENQQENLSDYIGDLALEYKITNDGRFRITGFYNSNYDMIDGELKETGVGLIYIKDYNSLRELFKANGNGVK